ncbi:MAG: MaoC family dehydratase [Ignavibacterium sp.]
MNNLKVGNYIEKEYTITRETVEEFAKISGDLNPIHVDSTFAASTPFKKPIVHGMLIASYFSKIIGNDFPGKGSIYLGQNLEFKVPIFVGEKIKIRIQIIDIRIDKPILKLNTICLSEEGVEAVKGEAVVKLITLNDN